MGGSPPTKALLTAATRPTGPAISSLVGESRHGRRSGAGGVKFGAGQAAIGDHQCVRGQWITGQRSEET